MEYSAHEPRLFNRSALLPAALFFAAWAGEKWRRKRLSVAAAFVFAAFVATVLLGLTLHFTGYKLI